MSCSLITYFFFNLTKYSKKNDYEQNTTTSRSYTLLNNQLYLVVSISVSELINYFY